MVYTANSIVSKQLRNSGKTLLKAATTTSGGLAKTPHPKAPRITASALCFAAVARIQRRRREPQRKQSSECRSFYPVWHRASLLPRSSWKIRSSLQEQKTLGHHIRCSPLPSKSFDRSWMPQWIFAVIHFPHKAHGSLQKSQYVLAFP